jgi:hypothetical protein
MRGTADGGTEVVLERALGPEAWGGNVKDGLIERSSARRVVWKSWCIESSYMAYVRAMPDVSWPAMSWSSISEATDWRIKSGPLAGEEGAFSMLLAREEESWE